MYAYQSAWPADPQPDRQRGSDAGRLRLRNKPCRPHHTGDRASDRLGRGLLLASGTNWWVDPVRKLVVVFMAHTPGTVRWHYRYLINTLVYQALEN